MKKRYIAIILFFIAGSIFAQVPRLYVGGKAGLGPLFLQDGTDLGGNINPVQLGWQMNSSFLLETGMGFYFGPETKYTAPKQTDPGSGIMETYSGMETHMLFPLVVKATLRPGNFLVEFGGGLYVAPVLMSTGVERTNDSGYTVTEGYGKNLFSAETDNPFGFIVSGSFGVRIGHGVIFLDLGYLRDFSEVTVKFNDVSIRNNLWNILAVNVGYKYGFFQR
ncbi:MAG: hypothetical protein FWF22_01510 [Treponema sp.]|nr:hypothetical protein [Treponema sp.]